MVPVIHSSACLISANWFWAFLCIVYRKCFLLGRQPFRPNWFSVANGLTTGRVTPFSFNLCSNAYTYMFERPPLDAMNVHWTMARPVLSLTSLFKPLDGLGLTVSGCWQSSYFQGSLYVKQQTSESCLPWGAMLNTKESLCTGEGKFLILLNLDIFT